MQKLGREAMGTDLAKHVSFAFLTHPTPHPTPHPFLFLILGVSFCKNVNNYDNPFVSCLFFMCMYMCVSVCVRAHVCVQVLVISTLFAPGFVHRFWYIGLDMNITHLTFEADVVGDCAMFNTFLAKGSVLLVHFFYRKNLKEGSS